MCVKTWSILKRMLKVYYACTNMACSTLPNFPASSSKAVQQDEYLPSFPSSLKLPSSPHPLLQTHQPSQNHSLVQYPTHKPCHQAVGYQQKICNIKQLELTLASVSNTSCALELQITLLDSICHLLLEFSHPENSSYGRGLLDLAVSQGLDGVNLLRDRFIRLFSFCGSLQNANRLFLKARNPSVYSWQAIISACMANNQCDLALSLFDGMWVNGVRPNKFVFTCMLKVCGNMRDISQGRRLHQQVIDCYLDSDLAVGTSLIEMYFKCGMVEKAQEVFD
eukprot:c20790_g3_i1 orf=1-834(-)